MGAGQVVAFLAKNPDEPHSCPRDQKLPPIFLPAMQDYSGRVKCPYCEKEVYQVPARGQMEQFGYALQFDRVLWRWEVHPHGLLPGIWDYGLLSLTCECLRSSLPQPYRLVTVVCVKHLAGPGGAAQLHLVALKSVAGERFCSFFAGDARPVPGDLAVLCGVGTGQRLLVYSNNSSCLLHWDWQGSPENLYLPRRWLQDTG
jgi:hypothetical protein